MQTSTIRLRVADFLKQHPPFQFLGQDDLLELAGAGRVRFHQGEEVIFAQGTARKPYVWVVQQGSVRLDEEAAGAETLRDILGEGDLLGIGGFTGAENYLYSARSVGDVLLYAFQAQAFEKIVARYGAVQRYLEARFTVQPGARNESAEPVQRLANARLLAALAEHRLLTCTPETPAPEAAAAMRLRDAEAMVVVDASGQPVGLVGWRQLRDALAQGAAAAEVSVGSVAVEPRTASAGLPMEAYQLQMMEAAGGYLIITSDGTRDSQATGLLSSTDLSLLIGVNPALLALEAGRTRRAADLAPLVTRAKALVAQTLANHHRAEWAAHVAGELNAAILARLVELAERELAENEPNPPVFRRCWLLLGGSGRRELMTWVDLSVGVLFEDLPDAEREAAEAWLAKVAKRVDAGLEASGFSFTEAAERATEASQRLSLSDWRGLFDGWITAPLENRIYASRPYFDFRTAAGDRSLANELREHVLSRVAENPGFLQLLANDCLANLPPVTFYHGLVVEDSGVESEQLDLSHTVLNPLVDTARVFALNCGYGGSGTFERFSAAAAHDPGRERLFAAAQEAYRLALAHRGRLGLAAGDDGSSIDPSRLNKVDQQILKGAFRTIADLLRHTVEVFELEGDE